MQKEQMRQASQARQNDKRLRADMIKSVMKPKQAPKQ
jgi:hypothetical protein